MNDDLLSDLIGEIFEGRSIVNSSFGKVYLRHFDQLESRKIIAQRPFFIEEAKNKGIQDEEEALARLIEDKMWSKEEEDFIQKKLKFIESLKAGTVKIKIPSKREVHKKMIRMEEDKLQSKVKERASLLGLTSKIFADQKINKMFLDSIVFINEEMTKPAMEDLDYTEVDKELEITKIQKDFFDKFSDGNISKAALCPFFGPYLTCTEDVLGLYGKPMKDLTTFQLRLIAYGRSFLSIFKNAKKEIPPYIAKDPELLMEFHEAEKNNAPQRKTKASEGSGGTTYFGANEKDIESLAEDDEKAVKLSDEINKKGGQLNMQQMMELHGL